MREGPAWIPGSVVEVLGSRTYLVEIRNGELWQRHLDHIRDGQDSRSDRDRPCPRKLGIDTSEQTEIFTSNESSITHPTHPTPTVAHETSAA